MIFDGEPTQNNIVPMRVKRDWVIEQLAPVTDVTFDSRNAEPAIFVTDSGTMIL
jgi:hypothetical protein